MSASAHASANGSAPRIGTAGWSIRSEQGELFPGTGSHLERYARRFNAVEINSSFYRPHRRTTYERWAASVPADFAFAVKVPRAITHERRLVDADAALEEFLAQATGLGDKLGVLLVQLPPSFAFDAATAGAFFTALRARYHGNVAFEPRHATWFTPQADAPLLDHRIARAAADPAVVPAAAKSGGWMDLQYVRLHGAPRTYYSSYAPEQIADYAEQLKRTEAANSVWCIFDNTALGAATENALALSAMLASWCQAGPGGHMQTASTHAAASPSDHDVLLQLNTDYINSVQRSDVSRFDEILASDFYCSNPDGSLVDRAAFLRQTAKPVTIANLRADDVMIRIMDDFAIIHARTSYTLPDGRAGGGRYTDVWAKRDGRWLAVSAHVTRL